MESSPYFVEGKLPTEPRKRLGERGRYEATILVSDMIRLASSLKNGKPVARLPEDWKDAQEIADSFNIKLRSAVGNRLLALLSEFRDSNPTATNRVLEYRGSQRERRSWVWKYDLKNVQQHPN